MLRRLVETACKALKEEDDFLRTTINQNNTVYSEQRAGILRPGFLDERYYQRLVARQLLSEPYEVLLEKTWHDLVLMHPTKDCFAVIEMKLWMDKEGNTAGIVGDLGKLKNSGLEPQHRVMLIFSANPTTDTQENFKWLNQELSPMLGNQLKEGDNFEVCSFPTSSDYFTVKQLPMEFWVAGIEVS
jgi:hypothetical protein